MVSTSVHPLFYLYMVMHTFSRCCLLNRILAVDFFIDILDVKSELLLEQTKFRVISVIKWHWSSFIVAIA